MIDFIWNLFQDSDIQRLRAEAERRGEHSSSMQERAASTEARLLELERRHEQLKLVTLSLWRLLKDKVDLSDAELEKYVASTDLLDGVADGAVDLSKELIKCRHCDHVHLNTAVVCPFCGARSSSRNAFDVT
ncbi:hypothetical protein [Peristeroidobacter agariperforans]|uniref:hypothetical protein n=1 Tax=Peristeroidobacter agariperforans TaxID=268404 RepID=UPI00101BC405|nr:hypothetical protein [Peristeroidobacter agariperforans]